MWINPRFFILLFIICFEHCYVPQISVRYKRFLKEITTQREACIIPIAETTFLDEWTVVVLVDLG